MGKESTQHKLDRVRSPRVHITYDVETGGAIQMKELPFVVGVLSDLAGKPKDPLKPLKERKFIDIDTDTFDDVMRGMSPRLDYSVENKLKDDGSKIKVEMEFSKMEDFTPESVVNKVEPLKKLLEVRQQLFELLAKADGNDKLTERLQEIIGNTDELQKLATEAGVKAPAADSPEETKEG